MAVVGIAAAILIVVLFTVLPSRGPHMSPSSARPKTVQVIDAKASTAEMFAWAHVAVNAAEPDHGNEQRFRAVSPQAAEYGQVSTFTGVISTPHVWVLPQGVTLPSVTTRT